MANEGKHTPGPWQLSRLQTSVLDKNGTLIASASYNPRADPEYPNTGRPVAVQQANARLIAAAPELLEALRTVATLPGFEPMKAYGQQVLAAIAKAEGREG